LIVVFGKIKQLEYITEYQTGHTWLYVVYTIKR